MGYAKGNKPEYIQLTGYYEEGGFEALVKRYPGGKVQRLMRWNNGAGVSVSDDGQDVSWPKKWHFHEDTEETYVVMEGKIAMAVYDNIVETITVDIYRKGDSVTISRGQVHNTLESEGARVSVTKVVFSDEVSKDWNEAKVDDSKLLKIPTMEIFQECGWIIDLED